MRAHFYFAMAALQDEEIQRKRMVGIYYGVGQKKVFQGRLLEYLKNTNTIPLWAVSLHYCTDNNNSILTSTVQFLCKVIEKKELCRVRFHVGKSIFWVL
jgi:tRNA A37 threonylcarbamoyltransferase TsaD